MNLSVITGSRADYGLLEWPLKLLREDPFFSVAEVRIWGQSPAQALQGVTDYLADAKPDYVLLLGDRFEIMAAAMAAHLQRIPIAHIGGGEITEGSYDDAMRDCISRMATLHFATSLPAALRLERMGYSRIHIVGNPGIDYIRNAPWKKARPIAQPYIVVSYQAETIDAEPFIPRFDCLSERAIAFILPNADAGSDAIAKAIFEQKKWSDIVFESLSHADFLNLLAHCEEFIGNSSAILYEAPELGIKTRMIGKRQQGRVPPAGDGKASERIRDILKAHG